jgi:lon-related putative ATP-dependent protease
MIGFSSMEEVKPLTDTVGQDRALRALELGLKVKYPGYNVFITGMAGTGRTTTVKRLLHALQGRPAELTDKCYVHNFRDPDAPLMIKLPAGQGIAFTREMANFLAELQRSIPAVFESRRYVEQRKKTIEHFQERQRTVLRDFEKRVRTRGFEVVQVQGSGANRPEIAPVIDGSPVSLDQLPQKVDAGEMTQEVLNGLQKQHAELEGQMDLVMREMRNIERKAKRSLDDLNHRIVVPVVEELLDEFRERYPTPRVQEYLRDVQNDILSNPARFHQREEAQQSMLGLPFQKEEDNFVEFRVNVIVDNSDTKGPPVVLETNPRFKNLFGTIERVVDRNGVWRTDFTRVKAGSLLKADGGFIVINALDALTEPGVWNMLKRVLHYRQLEIQAFEAGFFGSASALKPEPIDIDTKVVMVGDSHIYHLLYDLDDDFKKIFKVRADFDIEMDNNPESIGSYVSFIKTMCEMEKLATFDVSGVAEVVEYGARLAAQQKKLSTRFSVLADVLRESTYWAAEAGDKNVTGLHVRKAIDERIERVNLIEQKIQEMILDGSILIDTQGTAVGQVNGLSVLSLPEFEFGRPSRITAKTSMGRAGIINIERESSLSGPTHNKGVLILGGYLRWQYAQDKSLVLSASIAFEQSYSGVDGDSASSTEVYALLSSLSGVPLRQDLAITGSINQHGEIQPIGGVNAKIEGFFDVCKARGLTGTQGVLIPHQNVNDLMLRHDVVEAVAKKLFHVYAVRTIDEGIEILSGRPAGKRLANGKFQRGTIHGLVDARLTELSRKQKKNST